MIIWVTPSGPATFTKSWILLRFRTCSLAAVSGSIARRKSRTSFCWSWLRWPRPMTKVSGGFSSAAAFGSTASLLLTCVVRFRRRVRPIL